MSVVRPANYPGFDPLSERYGLSSAVSVPAGCRLVFTSGHIGMDDEGKVKEDLRAEMELAFKVYRSRPSSTDEVPALTNHQLDNEQNVEKSIQACEPDLTPTQIWQGVTRVLSYHVEPFGEETTELLKTVAESFMGQHRPAWAAVGIDKLSNGRVELIVTAAYPPASK